MTDPLGVLRVVKGRPPNEARETVSTCTLREVSLQVADEDVPTITEVHWKAVK